MEIKQTKKNNVKVLQMIGRLDAVTAPDLELQLIPLIKQYRQKIVIDFSSLEYISSAGLRVLLLAMKTSKKMAGELILCSLQDHIREIFDIAGFLPIFTIRENLEESLL